LGFVLLLAGVIAGLSWGAFRLAREPRPSDARFEVAQDAHSFPEIRKAFVRGQPARAIELIGKLPPEQAGSPDAQAMLARAHLLTGHLGVAEDLARAVIATDPGQVEVWCTLGLILQIRGRLPDAEAALDKAIAADSGASGPLLARAKIRQESGRPAEERWLGQTEPGRSLA
jgi:tetratricopeptide (TPR) repeat protein